MFQQSRRAVAIEPYDTSYAHWDRTALDRPQSLDFLCVLVKLSNDAEPSAVRAFIGDPAHTVHISAHELERLDFLIAHDMAVGAELFVFVPSTGMDAWFDQHAAMFTPVEILAGAIAGGMQVSPSGRALSAGLDKSVIDAVASRVTLSRYPVMCVIDDEIGYLNTRFCAASQAGALNSRMQAVWVQHAAHLAAEGLAQGPVLENLTLNQLVADIEAGRLDEARAYAQFLPDDVAARRGRLPAVTHGTHVLDLAAGSDPNAALHLPIFAVELPGFALSDPGARRIDAYLIQGIRWLVQRALSHTAALNAAALAADDGTSPIALFVPDIVLNCSIGSFAGPKDGSGFYARLVGAELDIVNRFEAVPGVGVGGLAKAVLFQSFGNAFGNGQAAAHDGAQHAGPIDWVLPRGDTLSSTLELRMTGATLDKLHCDIQGTRITFEDMSAHRYRSLKRDGQVVARLYRDADEANGRQVYRLFVCPTDVRAGGGSVPMVPGALRLTAELDAPGLAHWQVQRDDTPFGYEDAGKQSYLAAPGGLEWSAGTRSYTQPSVQSPIILQGTETAEAHSAHPMIVTVAACLSGDDADPIVPSGYSAAGAVDIRFSGRSGPDVSATGDESAAVQGVLASGSVSGSTARLSGTSVAAPLAARRYAMTGVMPDAGMRDWRRGPRYEDLSGARDARRVWS